MTKKTKPAKAAEKTDDYDVGFKKPPKSGQFKPGKSGNPKGRPKQSKNLMTLLNKELDEPVTISEKGKIVKLTKREVIIKRIVNDAAGGKMPQIKALLSMTGTDPDVDPNELVSDDDLEVLSRFTNRLLGGKNDD